MNLIQNYTNYREKNLCPKIHQYAQTFWCICCPFAFCGFFFFSRGGRKATMKRIEQRTSRTFSCRLPLNLCVKDFADKPDGILREQFQGRERQNESHSGDRNIYSLRHKLRGWGSGRGCRPLMERNSYPSWEEILLENLKSKVPAESIVLLPLGKRGPRVQFICFVLITTTTKKLLAPPCDFKYEQNLSMERRAGYSVWPPSCKRTLNYKSISDLKED